MEWRRSRYEDDIYAWSEEQAEVLRRLAESRRDLPNELDLEHIAEEIEDVGTAQRNAAESFIRQIFVHLIKLSCAPDSPAARHWRSEILGFHIELADRLTPSMKGRIDLEKLWTQAVRLAAAKLDAEGETNGTVSAQLGGVPLTIEDLAREQFDVDATLAALSKALRKDP